MSQSPSINLDRLVSPDEIARRITASSGVLLPTRTVWEKANRIGVARKIGRSLLISIDDIPALLKQEDKKAHLNEKANASRALKHMKRDRKQKQKVFLEKME